MTIKELHQTLKSTLVEIISEFEMNDHLRLIFEEVFDYTKADIVLNGEKVLTLPELEKVEKIVERLSVGEPIQYILGYCYFYGRKFITDSRALIPRPETEELVSIVLEKEKSQALSILDIGSGSGCIPISLKLEGGYNKVDGIEVSAEAIEQSIQNARALGAKLDFVKMDILKEQPSLKYDIIVSNPPYVKKEELNILDKNVIEYEPVIALAPEDDDPLIFYKRILAINENILEKGGRLYFEIHEDLGNEVLELFKPYNYSQVELKEDMFGKDRFVLATKD